MKRSSVVINNLILAFGIACILFYLVCGITVRFGQSLLFMWALLGAACVCRWALWRRAWKNGRAHPFPGWLLAAARCALIVCFAFFCFVEYFVFSAAFSAPKDGLDAIVILGARVNEDGAPSGSLRERIVSEAQCIFERLTAAGIGADRILIEDRSTSTQENLSNSFALLGDGISSVGIVTNDFHIYRALCTGRELGNYLLSPVPARSSLSGFVHYSMREFFALTVSWIRGELPPPYPVRRLAHV